ncbi:MAG: BolA family transcriptional regulator [Aestuariivirgaceae bacterium]|nr:BolA family transcriptional regulator [Aestuariivirgaceae bacterium]
MELGTVGQTITAKLKEAFQPATLEVVDESHRHHGHSGARPEGETHFRIVLRSEAFRGKSRLDRQRMVNAALAEELRGPVHALSMDVDV